MELDDVHLPAEMTRSDGPSSPSQPTGSAVRLRGGFKGPEVKLQNRFSPLRRIEVRLLSILTDGVMLY